MPKPTLPQGTRDFNAETVYKRQYIFSTIRSVFERYGYQPLETPSFEQLETLMGKYGDEGDQLIFKILNNGLNHPDKKQKAQDAFDQIMAGKSTKDITERALRYDLTIPFARYVATHHGQLTMPFKRFQMQPVWRADRPQKGRYREFYQCDADVVGSKSLLNEVEFIHMYDDVFSALQLKVEIRINHRQILAALAEACGGEQWMTPITVAIDKLEKVGIDQVKSELISKGVSEDAWKKIQAYLEISGTNEEKITAAEQILGNIPSAQQAIADFKQILQFPSLTNLKQELMIDFTLARGLNYYTGCIFEIKSKEVAMGSIGGGGRYDNLTGSFGVPGVPGAGISFGVDRVYDVIEELKRFPTSVQAGTQVLFFHLEPEASLVAFNLMQQLRKSGVRAEMFHESAKFDKQFKYAEKKQIPYVIILGAKEVETNSCVVKNLTTGQQESINQSQLLQYVFEG
jgi:histidyl-tRNA synthetase